MSQVVISINSASQQIQVNCFKNRSATSLIRKLSYFEYQSRDKVFLIPTEVVFKLISDLSAKKIKVLIDPKLKEQLKNSQDVRNKIISREYSPKVKDLQESLLFPFLKVDSQQISLNCYSTEQLKIVLPAIRSHAERKRLVSNLSLEAAVKLLYQALLVNKKIWLESKVKNLLLNYRKTRLNKLGMLGQEFDDYLLAIYQPEVCLSVDDGQAAIFARGVLELKDIRKLIPKIDSAAISGVRQVGEVTFFTTFDSKLVKLNHLISGQGIPCSRGYQQKLEEVGQIQEKVEANLKLQNLKDCDLKMKNQQLVSKLYPHQRVAIKWLLNQPRAYLADDMGLGKTLSVLAYAEELRQKNLIDFVLIICPNSLILNWQQEANHWFSNFKLNITPNTKPKRQQFLERVAEGVLNHQSLVINYEEVRLKYVTEALVKILKQKKVLICFDESQRVKNPSSKTFDACSKLSKLASYRVLLSGTPTPKNITDLWTQVYLLDDGERLGQDYYTWLGEVAELGSKWSRVAVKKFYDSAVQNTLFKFQELLLRRNKDQVLDLPDKIFINRNVKLTGNQKTLYEQIRKDLLVNLRNTDGKTYQKKIDSILEEFLRAVQVASNPRIIDPNFSEESAKFLELDQLVEDFVINNQQKIVIWTNYKQNVYDLLDRYSGHNAKAIFGEVKKHVRHEIVEDFQNNPKGCQVIIAIPAAAGVGLTLTAASTAIYLDKTWNAEHWLQSIDRIYRIGQEQRVRIISLHAGGVDYMISSNLSKKSELIKQVLGESSPDDYNETYPSKDELIAGLEN